MSIETNRALGKQFFASQDKSRGGPSRELCTAGYTAQINTNPATNWDGHDGFAKMFYGGLPDALHEVELVIADEHTAVVRFVIHGTNTGSLFGIPPTGKKVAVPAHVILKLEGGKVHELIGLFDQASLLRQIGALPG